MEIGSILITLFYILVAAKIGGELAERIKQPAVLGELIAGVVVGSSVLGLVQQSEFIGILAQLGAIVLLFEAGVTSDYASFMGVKLWAFVVACVGVVFPFIFGYFVSSYFGLSLIQAIFVGATLTATSVGITVRVFQDLGKIRSREAQIVIGAAVVDDVIGLIILATIVGIISFGTFSIFNISKITGIAVAFLAGAVIVGNFAAPYILKFIHNMRVRGMLSVFSFSFCLLMAYFSILAGLAPIVGAFAAGLIISKTEHQEKIASDIKPIADIFVPIFFVMMGAAVNLGLFNFSNPANHPILIFALALFVVAVIGKVIAGFFVFENINKLVVGIGMIPRGEVGLIFAAYGLTHKIIGQELYTSILLVVILTTFIVPPILKQVLSKSKV